MSAPKKRRTTPEVLNESFDYGIGEEVPFDVLPGTRTPAFGKLPRAEIKAAMTKELSDGTVWCWYKLKGIHGWWTPVFESSFE